jgi:hypothetical protein
MPNALTNTNISATYNGVLHTDGTTIPPTGQQSVYDGAGAQSSLSIGRTNQGASVTGSLSATDLYAGQLRMPRLDGTPNQVVTRTGTGILELKSLSELIGGTVLTDNVYYNPKITVSGGVITALESRPTISLFDTQVEVFNYSSDIINIIGSSGTNTPVTFTIATTTINWNSITSIINGITYTSIPDGVKYVIVSTDLFTQSNGSDYSLSYSIDGLVVARGESREHWEFLGVDTMINTNQQFIKIPINKVSSTDFTVTKLPGSTAAKVGVESLNKASLKVSVVGWIY